MSFFDAIRGRAGNGSRPAAPHPPRVSLAAPAADHAAPASGARTLLDVSELVGAELNSAVAEVKRQTRRVRGQGAAVAQEAERIVGRAKGVARAAEEASRTVCAVAAAGERLSASARGIAAQAAGSAAAARETAVRADRAAEAIAALGRTVERIGGMARSIAEIAARTDLLALGAASEAARAGPAGRGVAAVADEIKDLAHRAKAATDDIARCVEDAGQAARASVATVRHIGGAVRGMDADGAAVAASAEEQHAAIATIAERLRDMASGVAEVARTVGAISGGSEAVGLLAADVRRGIDAVDLRLEDARSNVVVTLRRTTTGAAGETTVPTELEARLTAPGWRGRATVLELSDAAAVLRLPADAHEHLSRLPEGAAVRLQAGAGLDAAVAVVASSRTRSVVRADGTPFARAVADVRAKDAHFGEAARALAARISARLDRAVARGECTEADVFDAAYVPVEGSDPAQHTTRFCAAADRLVRPLLDSLLDFDPRVVGVFACDRNGYAPTHNARCSLPQRLGDPLWNAVHSRNRRLFDDRAGLSAGTTTRDVLVQCYERDMGGGRVVTVREADAPIRVGGRHWGAVRLMYRGGGEDGSEDGG